jgi:aldehyde:ferredoxin oxidoreductase
MPGGYMGKLLFVDLTSGFIREDSPEEQIYRDFIGGLGLGVRILYERMKANTDPLSPDNWLGFVTGPLTGTAALGTGRFMVVTKSPLTETWCDSNAGGRFGPKLKAAGYDGIFVTGCAPKAVYLWVRDGKAELRDARHIWGKDTVETEEILRQELNSPGAEVACIGPAGELLSSIAAVIHDGGRAAARGGVGAIMGSKRLKAIVVAGEAKVPVANQQRLTALRRDVIRASSGSPVHELFSTQGTCAQTSPSVKQGLPGIKNWKLIGEEGMPNHAKINGPEMNKYKIKGYTCYGCPLSCGGKVEIKSGPYAVGKTHRPEYESIAALGTMCLNESPESIIKGNDVCNRYGLDTISAGSVIAFAMECYEYGIIGKTETEGVELTWGNSAAIVDMLEKIARREGFGVVLADGVKKASERIGKGAQEYAMHVHGAELPMHDPRPFPGRGVLYMDANPGRHTIGSLPAAQDRGTVIGPYSVLETPKLEVHGDYLAKGPMYAIGAEYFLFYSSAGLCTYAAILNTTYPLVEFVCAVTGLNFTASEGLTAGQRIATLRQCFNIREGLKPEDLRLPDRLRRPATTGPFADVSVDFDSALATYYAAMGWDLKTGKPYRRTLAYLGLDELTKDLEDETKQSSCGT